MGFLVNLFFILFSGCIILCITNYMRCAPPVSLKSVAIRCNVVFLVDDATFQRDVAELFRFFMHAWELKNYHGMDHLSD